MKKKTTLASLEAEHRKLAQSLTQTGFISRGSVFKRKGEGSGSLYQWSWKDSKQKTRSLTLSAEQYHWLKEAVARERTMQKTLRKMRQISHRVLLEHIPSPPRRKQLTIKSLSLI